MFVTEAELRDQLRRPTLGATVSIPVGARLSPSAADFVKQWELVTVVADDATTTPPDSAGPPAPGGLAWDKASVFPVQLTGERPVCVTCGETVQRKPSGLTQLNAQQYAPKTHPRIKLRGRMDSLHAMVMLIQRMARDRGQMELSRDLGTIAAYCRELTSAEYHERPVAELHLREADADRMHAVTHDPSSTLGIEHLTIDETDPVLMHWLNLARTTSREIEITAMETFPDPDDASGASICHALNRLSSAFYFLQLQLAASEPKQAIR